MSDLTQGRALDWDDEIENDGQEFVLLPEGDYDFVVESFDRSTYEPKAGSKLPACKMAVLNVRVDAAEGTAYIKHRLYLHTNTEGLISAFFAAIGQKEKGERVRMNWNAVPGSKGRCKVGIHEWTNDKGEVMKSNDIKRFYPKAEKPKFTAGAF